MSTVSTTTRTRTAETAAASVPASSAASMRYDAPIATANRSDGAPVVQRLASESDRRESFEETPLWCALSTYLIWGLYIIIAYVRTFLAKIGVERVKHKEEAEKNTKGFVPLYASFESTYTYYIYRRIRDCWDRPIASCAGARFDVMERVSDDQNRTYKLTGRKINAINLSSYNYLGFAETSGSCADAAIDAIKEYGVSPCSSRREVGTLALLKDLERLVAEFLHKPAAMVFGMGFGTNSMNIPALAGKGSLIISDELNHSSLVLGIRLSGAKVVTFKHNDMKDLEAKLRHAVVYGHPRTRRPYKKIIIFVEGVYSMEGSVVHLKKVVELKKKYKAYIYLDEAHSIGCMGESGRGISEYWGVDTSDIDVMMGTFTKSFGASGGYIAASHVIIDHLRRRSHNDAYATAMSAPVAAQTLESMRIIMGKDGTDEGKRRIRQLAENTRYLRRRLMNMGYIVYGNYDSPVIPVMIFQPSKIPLFSRTLLERNIGVVVAGFPATSIITTRARFCMSSALTREALDEALGVLDEIGDTMLLKQASKRDF